MIKNVSYSKDREIDFRSIISLLLRNKYSIIIFSALFFTFACVYAVTTKRVWEGQFEIVLSSNKEDPLQSTGLTSSAKMLLSGTKSPVQMGSINIPTEIVILNSSSVLMPIFDYVKSEKTKVGLDMSDVTFKEWKREKFFITNPNETSVLIISYRDTDKKLILNVLDSITREYQQYSGKRKKRQLELTSNYLNKQIEIYKTRSANSLKKAQEYAIEQNLNIFSTKENLNSKNISSNFSTDEVNVGNDPFINNISSESIAIEIERINVVNQIRIIDNQIKMIKEIKNDVEKLAYIGSTIPILVSEGLPQNLKATEEKLLFQKSKYNQNDRSIKILEERRELLSKLLTRRAIGILNARRSILDGKREAAMRPKEVILKYKELVREASRDEATLIGLEDQFKLVSLEKSRIEDPWELITNPTISKKPVYPQRKKIAFIGLLFGFITGFVVAKIREEISGKIFDIFQVNEILKTSDVPVFNDDKSGELFLNGILKNSSKNSLTLINPLKVDSKSIFSIKDLIGENKIKLEKNLNKLTNNEDNVLILSLENLSKVDVYNIEIVLKINEIKLLGILLLN